MHTDSIVLRAMLRLARQRAAADLDSLVARTRAPASDVRVALRRLEAAGLVAREGAAPSRLTLAGFAVAIASSSGAPSRAAAPAPRDDAHPAKVPARRATDRAACAAVPASSPARRATDRAAAALSPSPSRTDAGPRRGGRAAASSRRRAA